MKKMLIFIGLSLILCSCGSAIITWEQQEILAYQERIVTGKAIEPRKHEQSYILGFNDGTEMHSNFGVYSTYEIGDTVCQEQRKNMGWRIVNCK